MSASERSSNAVYTLSNKTQFAISGLGKLVSHWQETLDYENMAEFQTVFTGSTPGSLILCWHNRLFPILGALKQAGTGGRKVYALVSASRDGAQLAQFIKTLGIRPIHGSSSRRGGLALRELLKVLSDGNHVAITVDGPRGPCYQAQPGAAMLLQITKAPVFFLGAECESTWEVNSWDRLLVPSPFSRVAIKMDRYAHPADKSGKDDRKAIQELIQERLDKLTGDTHREA